MAIVHMAANREDAEAKGCNVRLLPKGAYANSSDIWLYDTYVGRCIKSYEHNGYDDSDFWMVVWDDETESPKHIEFATTRGWSYPCLASESDATEDVKAKYAEWERIQREEDARRRADFEAKIPEKGRYVRILKGKHKGKSGMVIWYGKNMYANNRYAEEAYSKAKSFGLLVTPPNMRVGVNVGEPKPVFVDADNVEVTCKP